MKVNIVPLRKARGWKQEVMFLYHRLHLNSVRDSSRKNVIIILSNVPLGSPLFEDKRFHDRACVSLWKTATMRKHTNRWRPKHTTAVAGNTRHLCHNSKNLRK